jgi:hypothetical protein
LRFVRGVVYVAMVGYIVYHCYLRFVREVVYVVMVGYIVYHWYLRFVRATTATQPTPLTNLK